MSDGEALDEDLQTRSRKLTEKGQEYNAALRLDELKYRKTVYAKQYRHILATRSTSKDPDALQKDLDQLELHLLDVKETLGRLKELEPDSKEGEDLPQIEERFYDLKKEVHKQIDVLRDERLENSSVASRSSHVSKASRTSDSSQNSNANREKLAAAAAKLAALQVEMNFSDEQAEKDREWQVQKIEREKEAKKLQLRKEIAMTAAEQAVYKQFELEDGNTVPEVCDASPCTFAGEAAAAPMTSAATTAAARRDDLMYTAVPREYCETPFIRSPTAQLQPSLNPQANEFQPSPPVVSTQRQLHYGDTSQPQRVEYARPEDVYTPAQVAPQSSTQLSYESPERVRDTQFLQLINSIRLPAPEPPVFTGNILEYPRWSAAFNTLIEQSGSTPDMKIQYLLKYLDGSPKELVLGYQYCPSEETYQEAKRKLARRYGDPAQVSRAFKDKLNAWPKITSRDGEALRKYGDFLAQCDQAMSVVRGLRDLETEQENLKLVHKMPPYCVTEWAKILVSHAESYGSQSFPPFRRFVEFVQRQAEIACHPVLASAFEKTQSPQPIRTQREVRRRTGGQTFTTVVRSPSNSVEATFSCTLCEKDSHHLDECRKFQRKSWIEKRDFMRSKKLCYGCGVSASHGYAKCANKRSCRTCAGAHLTCFHRDKPKDEANTASAHCTAVCTVEGQSGGRDHAMIVPVWVRSRSTQKEQLCYAILDDQSNVSFITNELQMKLGEKGTSTNLSLSTMHRRAEVVSCQKVSNLEVLNHDRTATAEIRKAYTRNEIPASRSQIPKAEVARRWKHLSKIASQLMPYDPELPISILIGNDCPKAVRPREILAGEDDDPYAQKSILGWGIIGRVCEDTGESVEGVSHRVNARDLYPGHGEREPSHFVHSTQVREVLNPLQIVSILEADFADDTKRRKPYSAEDTQFVNQMEAGIRQLEDGHYEMPLPLKSEEINLPYNRPLAEKRLRQLKGRFSRDSKFRDDYRNFMKDITDNWAERVPKEELNTLDGKVNYIPHTGVYHPKKPGKIRVVFDCSAKYAGVSLNDHLLQGPDLINAMVGVLMRFRQEKVAVIVDIKSMFHQFMVAERYRNLLRFLWWQEGNPDNEPVEYRMKVHLFGAVSSPGCTNFGLQRAAQDGESEFGKEAADFIRRNFYVDDGLASVPTVEKAMQLIQNTKGICARAGLKLHKFMSTSRELLESLEADETSAEAQSLDLSSDRLPTERVLGIMWCVESDSFKFRIELNSHAYTRRGVLSTVCSVYDPLGFVGPLILVGKQILQQLCQRGMDWDDPLPDHIVPKWEGWLREITQLDRIDVPRCFKPAEFSEPSRIELHHFSDASQVGYGQCTYLRLVDQDERVHCSFVLGKARVAPLRQFTIPKLELAAATVSAKVSSMVRSELDYGIDEEYFYTDSQVVLGYVKNHAKRFHVYVANRVQQIHDVSRPEQWFHVDTQHNPADAASRGLSAKQLFEDSLWLRGPSFLWQGKMKLHAVASQDAVIDERDPEVKRSTCHRTEKIDTNTSSFELERLGRYSDWMQALKAVAYCLRFKSLLMSRKCKKPNKPVTLSRESYSRIPRVNVSELEEARQAIVRCVQSHYFQQELSTLSSHQFTQQPPNSSRIRDKGLQKTNPLYRLDPYVDSSAFLRIGGRLVNADLSTDVKNPIILPKESHVTTLITRHYHEVVNHMGRSATHNEIRQHGYWIIQGSKTVARYISKCVMCRKIRGAAQQQKMSDLPTDRVNPAPPFTYCAVDYFGPFLVKEGRKELKRYGVLFVCMASRAIHLETANSLETDSFINALRRFMCRRGPVRQLRSDRGTNFVGANNELRKALESLDKDKIQQRLLHEGCEWIHFKMNVPHASHQGGIWERQIRTVRNALEPLLRKCGAQLDDESLRTFLTEAEYVVNSRPLTVDSLSSPDAPEPLTANHLLTMKEKIVMPPPGNFSQEDVYSRRRWRRVQHLANEFWTRWKREYLQTLQTRSKWSSPKDNLSPGDVVLLPDANLPRSLWQLAMVDAVLPCEDGLVRKVRLRLSDRHLSSSGARQSRPTLLERPIHQIVLLYRETGAIPVEEPEDTSISP